MQIYPLIMGGTSYGILDAIGYILVASILGAPVVALTVYFAFSLVRWPRISR